MNFEKSKFSNHSYLPLDQFWPDRFSRFDVFRFQTNQTDKQSMYIDYILKQGYWSIGMINAPKGLEM